MIRLLVCSEDANSAETLPPSSTKSDNEADTRLHRGHKHKCVLPSAVFSLAATRSQFNAPLRCVRRKPGLTVVSRLYEVFVSNIQFCGKKNRETHDEHLARISCYNDSSFPSRLRESQLSHLMQIYSWVTHMHYRMDHSFKMGCCMCASASITLDQLLAARIPER
jgi:hypothetical protein